MLNIDRRQATIGTSLNGRTQNHGDDKVPALDIELEGIVLSENELNALLRDPHAVEALFHEPGKGSTLAQPRFPQLTAFKFKEKFKGARVSIWLSGAREPIMLTDCNLAKVAIEPQEGGTTLLSCQVQSTQPADKSVAKLWEQMGHTVAVELFELQTDIEDEAEAA
jgi:hypothetical protein